MNYRKISGKMSVQIHELAIIYRFFYYGLKKLNLWCIKVKRFLQFSDYNF